MTEPLRFITSTPLGTRVVVRRRIEGGFTDALGYLRERNDTECVIETKSGMKSVPFDAVVAAKEVPPPPPRRAPRFPLRD